MKQLSLSLALVAAMVPFVMVGCSSDPEAQPEPEQPTEWQDPEGQDVTYAPVGEEKMEWKFNANTTYVKAPRNDQVEVLADSLKVPAAGFEDVAALSAGAVLIGPAHKDRAATNPGGFLRKIVSITPEGTNLVIQTEPARLEDAFETCNFNVLRDLPSFGDMTFSDPVDGKKFSPKSFGIPDEPGLQPAVAFDKSGLILFDNGTFKATVTSGKMDFTPSFDFTFDASLLKGLERFEAVASGAFSAELVVKFENTQGFNSSFSKNFNATPFGIDIGPLTAEITPRLAMGCTVNIPSGLSITAGAKATSNVAFGVSYVKDSPLQGIAQSNFTLTRIGPTFDENAASTARCFIKPSLEVKLSAVVASAGAKLSVEGFDQLTASVASNTCKLDYTVGVKGTADVDLKAFGVSLVDKEFTLFTKNAQLLDNRSCIPKFGN